jgi:hypothetical protein
MVVRVLRRGARGRMGVPCVEKGRKGARATADQIVYTQIHRHTDKQSQTQTQTQTQTKTHTQTQDTFARARTHTHHRQQPGYSSPWEEPF